MLVNDAKSNPVLNQLSAFVGEWKTRTFVGGQPVDEGRTKFEWLEDGAFLVQHADAAALPGAPPEWEAHSPFPVTTVMGLDDSSEQFSMLYADARGVFRVYQMSLIDGVWKMWRNAPGFFQRFTGTFSDDGNAITAYWEASPDGSTWERDFDLTYTRVGR